jgi:toxin ParE1/3/4
MPTVIRRQRAQHDLFEIWDWRASTYNEESADAPVQAITRAIRFLANNPFSGRARNELRPGLRSYPVKKYIIFYYPQKDGVIISRVLYGGRDIEALYDENEPDKGNDGNGEER